jgi:hypothetical protein
MIMPVEMTEEELKKLNEIMEKHSILPGDEEKHAKAKREKFREMKKGDLIQIVLPSPPDGELVREMVTRDVIKCARCREDFVLSTVLHNITIERYAKLKDNNDDPNSIYPLFDSAIRKHLENNKELCIDCMIDDYNKLLSRQHERNDLSSEETSWLERLGSKLTIFKEIGEGKVTFDKSFDEAEKERRRRAEIKVK